MLKLHNNRINNSEPKPQGQRQSLLYVESVQSPSHYKFSQETVDSFSELGSILLRIRKRLISEGYIVVDGKITRNENR